MDDEVHVHVAAGPLADAVLRRVVGAVAVQGELPIDRIQDATLIVDALLDELAADRLSAVFRRHEAGLEIALGPLGDGESGRILEDNRVPDVGPILRRLGDRVWIDTDRTATEYVYVLVRRQPGAG